MKPGTLSRRGSGLAPALLIALLSGCMASMDKKAGEPMAYDDALRICRGQHSGRASRGVGSDDAHVEQCLRTKGWLPDGQRAPDPSPR